MEQYYPPQGPGQGGPQYQQYQQQYPPYGQQPPQPSKPPKTWLVESILVTLLCCMPFGIVGIVYASKVETHFYAGRYAEAERASRDAGKWTKIGFICGLVVGLGYLALILGGITAGITDFYEF